MYIRVICVLFISSLALSQGNVLQSTVNVKKLQGILEEGLKSKDVGALHFAIKGLKQINAKIPEVCDVLKSLKYDISNLEQVFYITNAAALANCLTVLSPELLGTPTRTLDKKDATLQEIYYAVYSLKAMGKGTIMDKEDSLKNLIQLLKKDDSPANYGYVFALCEHMGCGAWTASHAEGVLLAADETDARALHFDGGLPATALILGSIARTYKSLKKASPLSEEQRYKFSNYVSGRSVSTPRGAALMLEAATALADDEPSPICIVIKGKKYVTSESDSVEISITDLIGRPVRGLKPEEVVAQSATRLADDVVVLSKQPLTQKSNDPTTFVLNLGKIKAQYGLYKISLSAGSKTANLNVAVLGEIQVSSLEVGIGDVDGTTSPKITTINYPNKLTEVLQADHMQKVSLKFSVRDKYNNPVSVQQAFVRIAPAHSAAPADLEAIFVAEPSAKTYRVELNVGAIAKHLNHQSGAHSLTLYLGDSAVSNPIAWQLGDIHFNFGKDTNALGAVVSESRQSRARGPLPEIVHQFREPEARPARAVSDVFAACCAAPLLLLLVMWARLSPRLRLPPMPVALVFHLALGGSLGLYVLLWLQLSMFATLRYLAPLALLTFLSGHRLLRRLAQDKQTR
ncbi:dolichyl-diphosphooligosaccharide--protein glycosyltransferase subunit 2 [Papilio machaon]|uniref:dolichyl-diphosphooligosaccharide--protein glycosyltransferase subunit 2 n=1 Tax=Papilio machaon TaxID=76193 RepID=UPI001E6632E1|nr:dolichyl-diphosphooligosaccharide--protein glycosyltransferase subunit 2 [Papilio machaon]